MRNDKYARRFILLAIHMNCFAVLLIAGLSIIGYLTSMDFLYKWSSSDPGMAIGTAVCFAVISFSFQLMTLLVSTDGQEKKVVIAQTPPLDKASIAGEVRVVLTNDPANDL